MGDSCAPHSALPRMWSSLVQRNHSVYPTHQSRSSLLHQIGCLGFTEVLFKCPYFTQHDPREEEESFCYYNRMPETGRSVKKRCLLNSQICRLGSVKSWSWHLLSCWWGPDTASSYSVNISGSMGKRRSVRGGFWKINTVPRERHWFLYWSLHSTSQHHHRGNHVNLRGDKQYSEQVGMLAIWICQRKL